MRLSGSQVEHSFQMLSSKTRRRLLQRVIAARTDSLRSKVENSGNVDVGDVQTSFQVP